MLAFLYSFANIFQPGIFWPEIGQFKPMVVLSLLVALAATRRQALYSRGAIFSSKPFIYLILFIAIQIISVYRSGFAAMLEEFDFWYAYAIYVISLMLVIQSEETLINAVWGMICGGLFIACYGIYAVLEKLPSALGGRAGAFGMYENHNDYSFVIILILPFIFMLYNEYKGVRKIFLGFALLSCVVGILFSLSRGGMLALVFEGLLLITIGYTGRRKALLLILMMSVGIGGIGYQWAKRAENQADYTSDDAKNTRVDLWRIGGNMVATHPFLGIGSRKFSEYAKDYGDVTGIRGKNSHNTYIEIATGTGLFGLILFVLYLKNLFASIGGARALKLGNRASKVATGVLISLYGIIVRSFLDAKLHDWSFYTLCALGVTTAAILQIQAYSAKENSPKDDVEEMES